MMTVARFRKSFRQIVGGACLALVGTAAITSMPLSAQSIETVDPDNAIDGDLVETPGGSSAYEYAAPPQSQPVQNAPVEEERETVSEAWSDPVVTSSDASVAAAQASASPAVAAAQGDTYAKDDLIGAAEGVFGKGAEGLARIIEGWLEKQGEPNGYIVGREAGGAFMLGARYGSGTLFHKIEGERQVYWTGPSIGFDVGANAGNTFVLVYNLYDTEDLFKRYPAGEGQAYAIGGMNASYLRRGDVVLIPIRVGAGLRLGVNAGYMRFSEKQRWLPF